MELPGLQFLCLAGFHGHLNDLTIAASILTKGGDTIEKLNETNRGGTDDFSDERSQFRSSETGNPSDARHTSSTRDGESETGDSGHPSHAVGIGIGNG